MKASVEAFANQLGCICRGGSITVGINRSVAALTARLDTGNSTRYMCGIAEPPLPPDLYVHGMFLDIMWYQDAIWL